MPTLRHVSRPIHVNQPFVEFLEHFWRHPLLFVVVDELFARTVSRMIPFDWQRAECIDLRDQSQGKERDGSELIEPSAISESNCENNEGKFTW